MKEKVLYFVIVVLISVIAFLVLQRGSRHPGQDPNVVSKSQDTTLKDPESTSSTNETSTMHLFDDDEIRGREVLALMERYEKSKSSDEKSRLLNELAELDTPEAARGIKKAFTSESNEWLKVEMMLSLSGMTNTKPVSVISRGLSTNQPVEIRTSAINSLMILRAPGSVYYLEQMEQDPDPDIRQQARMAIDLIRTPAATREQVRQFIGKGLEKDGGTGTHSPPAGKKFQRPSGQVTNHWLKPG